MNLFLLCKKRGKNAEAHCNRHVVKMPLEAAQMLWTAVHEGGADMTKFKMKPYRKTHVYHPTSIWVRESPKNWAYTVDLALRLCKEYTRRYKKVHGCESHLRYLKRLGYYPPLQKREITGLRGELGNGCTPFPIAIKEELRNKCVVYVDNKVDPVASYRNYYGWKREEWRKKGSDMSWKPKDVKVKATVDID